MNIKTAILTDYLKPNKQIAKAQFMSNPILKVALCNPNKDTEDEKQKDKEEHPA